MSGPPHQPHPIPPQSLQQSLPQLQHSQSQHSLIPQPPQQPLRSHQNPFNLSQISPQYPQPSPPHSQQYHPQHYPPHFQQYPPQSIQYSQQGPPQHPQQQQQHSIQSLQQQQHPTQQQQHPTQQQQQPTQQQHYLQFLQPSSQNPPQSARHPQHPQDLQPPQHPQHTQQSLQPPAHPQQHPPSSQYLQYSHPLSSPQQCPPQHPPQPTIQYIQPTQNVINGPTNPQYFYLVPSQTHPGTYEIVTLQPIPAQQAVYYLNNTTDNTANRHNNSNNNSIDGYHPNSRINNSYNNQPNSSYDNQSPPVQYLSTIHEADSTSESDNDEDDEGEDVIDISQSNAKAVTQDQGNNLDNTTHVVPNIAQDNTNNNTITIHHPNPPITQDNNIIPLQDNNVPYLFNPTTTHNSTNNFIITNHTCNNVNQIIPSPIAITLTPRDSAKRSYCELQSGSYDDTNTNHDSHDDEGNIDSNKRFRHKQDGDAHEIGDGGNETELGGGLLVDGNSENNTQLDQGLPHHDTFIHRWEDVVPVPQLLTAFPFLSRIELPQLSNQRYCRICTSIVNGYSTQSGDFARLRHWQAHCLYHEHERDGVLDPTMDCDDCKYGIASHALRPHLKSHTHSGNTYNNDPDRLAMKLQIKEMFEKRYGVVDPAMMSIYVMNNGGSTIFDNDEDPSKRIVVSQSTLDNIKPAPAGLRLWSTIIPKWLIRRAFPQYNEEQNLAPRFYCQICDQLIPYSHTLHLAYHAFFSSPLCKLKCGTCEMGFHKYMTLGVHIKTSQHHDKIRVANGTYVPTEVEIKAKEQIAEIMTKVFGPVLVHPDGSKHHDFSVFADGRAEEHRTVNINHRDEPSEHDSVTQF